MTIANAMIKPRWSTQDIAHKLSVKYAETVPSNQQEPALRTVQPQATAQQGRTRYASLRTPAGDRPAVAQNAPAQTAQTQTAKIGMGQQRPRTNFMRPD